MKKHILFIVENNTIPKDARVWNEAIAAKEFGYDVTIICPNDETIFKYEILEEIPIYSHFMPPEGTGKISFLIEYFNAILWEFILSLWIFIRKPFHYIHSANPPDHIFIIAMFFKIFGVEYIFDHHDISPENYVAKFGRKDSFYKILLMMEKLTFITAKIVISTNTSYKNIAINRGGKKENDVFVVRNGPNLSKIVFEEQNSDLKVGFEYLVAYVGAIGNQEGIENLLRSVEYIVNEMKILYIKFIIVGTGPHWHSLVQLSKEMKLERYVKFTGYIPYKDFFQILSTADVCVNPEYKNDFTDKSTMKKIMDYMVFGKPIVQFETTEGKITAGQAALNVKINSDVHFAEAIVDLLHNPIKRKEMGEIGRKRIMEKLNWEKQKIQLKKAYEYLEQSVVTYPSY